MIKIHLYSHPDYARLLLIEKEVRMPEKILIVDDDLETLRLLGMMLQRKGYEIIAANSGETAISMVKKELPDLIVLDVMMPVIDGYQVAREIRNDPVTAQIPILMFTSKSQIDDKVTGYDAGADDYLTKPVHPAELTAHVKSLLSRSVKPVSEITAVNPVTSLVLWAAKEV